MVADNVFEIEVPADMTIYEAAELKLMFLEAVKAHECLNVNLSKVSEIDSSGLQLMVSLKQQAAELNQQVSYHSHSQAVVALLDLFDLSSYFGDPIVMER